MVVTRKKPSAPAPPTSRTSSSQALPRAVTARPHSNLSTTSDKPSDTSPQPIQNPPNGTTTLKSKSKSKSLKSESSRRRERKRSFLDRLFLLFLATFAAYSLYACPSDVGHTSPICHALAAYRSYVLEPYVIPPIHAAITHPIIVQPYEKYAKPVYQNYVLPVTPYVAAAQRRTTPYVNTVVRFSKHTTARVWRGIVKPYWSHTVVPRYNVYVQPRVNRYISPIIKRVEYYNRRAKPFVQALARHTYTSSRKIQRFALYTYGKVKPHAIRAYNVAWPHVSRAYDQLKPFLSRAFKEAHVKGKYLAGETAALSQVAVGRVGELRRQYVDPHVLRIWEKAAEKSGSSPSHATPSTTVVAPTGSEDSIPDTTAGFDSVTTGTMEQPTAITSIVEPVLSSLITPDTIDNLPEEPDAVVPNIPTPTQTPEEALEKAARVAGESAAHASNIKVEEEIRLEEAKQVPFTSTPAPEEIPTATATGASEEVKSAASVVQASLHAKETLVKAAKIEDLDEFLHGLGLDDNGNEATTIPEPEPEIVEPVQEEEDEDAKRAAVAAKRADIVGRHVRWQSELDTLTKDLEGRVHDEIKNIRVDAIKHIGPLPSDKSGSGSDGKGKEVIEKIQAEGGKLLNGLEGYLKKLSSRDIAEEELPKEQEKWAKVVDKVENKFKDIVTNVQEEVHDWYIGIREKEADVVLSASREVRSLADRAQADLGLDYAWLDDVTYYDWQKYHDLMRTFEHFERTARGIQNGTRENSPEDELVPTLNNLDGEVQDVIAGFASRMSVLSREGDQWLSGILDPEDEEDGYDEEECEEGEEPQVSILPVPPVPVLEHVDPGNVVIGKNKEQIEELAKQAIIDGRIEL